MLFHSAAFKMKDDTPKSVTFITLVKISQEPMVPMHKVKQRLHVLAARFSSSLVLPSLHVDYLSDQRSMVSVQFYLGGGFEASG